MLIRLAEAFVAAVLASVLLLSTGTVVAGDAHDGVAGNTVSGTRAASAGQESAVDDVIARVGDEVITLNQLNTMLNSSAMVGLSVPAPGTAERSRVIITLLDKVISADLLYLDALRQGTDRDPGYQKDIRNFSDALLAGLYRQNRLKDNIRVDATEVEAVRSGSTTPSETALDGDVRLAIEAVLRNEKGRTQQAMWHVQLREGIGITLNEGELDATEDEVRPESEIVAMIDAEALTWGEVKIPVLTATRKAALSNGTLDPAVERRKALDKVIDYRIMIRKARAAGLDRDPVYRKRMDEFHKTHLINTWRNRLTARFEPSAEELEGYYRENRGRIASPESRKVHMVVVETREAAEDIKRRIESGELTLYKAAREYSIDPNAKRTLGDMGWVSKGSGFPELDRLTFSLGPDEIGGPVQSPAGWHVVVVTDIRDARFEDINEAATRDATRRLLLHDRLDQYAVNLRQNDFNVIVYEDKLQQLFRQEAALMAELESRAQQPDSLTRQREAEYQTLIRP